MPPNPLIPNLYPYPPKCPTPPVTISSMNQKYFVLSDLSDLGVRKFFHNPLTPSPLNPSPHHLFRRLAP